MLNKIKIRTKCTNFVSLKYALCKYKIMISILIYYNRISLNKITINYKIFTSILLSICRSGTDRTLF